MKRPLLTSFCENLDHRRKCTRLCFAMATSERLISPTLPVDIHLVILVNVKRFTVIPYLV